jgi:hypothetical protein
VKGGGVRLGVRRVMANALTVSEEDGECISTIIDIDIVLCSLRPDARGQARERSRDC